MSTLQITSNGEQDNGSTNDTSEQGASSNAGTTDNGSRPKRWIPSREDCLSALARLPGLIAMKIVTPAQANAIRASYTAILNEQRLSDGAQSGQLTDGSLLQILREKPELFELVEPFMTPDQVSLIIRNGQNDAEP
jgi:hypothetical protein